ncbi:hypothetical protein [Latilactobacillus sakei]|uniref:Uncharacterized protein n=1 Tax=Latilactobacillus sakei TaxID=1599 RepID=A0AAF0GUN0_LATSK|nr:hypothetical protein [Latilactobacillus sakei]WGI19901.1 hypothetical protein QBD03_04110 [Latilactobacillus sakei]
MTEKVFKSKRVYFYRVNLGKRTNGDSFQTNVISAYDKFYRRDYSDAPEATINGERIYISAMSKVVDFDDEKLENEDFYFSPYAILINIARVDPSKEVEYGVLTNQVDERRKTLGEVADIDDSGDNIGPLVNTQIIYDPFRRVLARKRSTGDLSNYLLCKFIKAAFDVKGISFEIMLNKKGMTDIDKFTSVYEAEYKIAAPDNFKSYANDDRSEFGDIKFASDVNSEAYKIVLTGANLTKKNLKTKLKNILTEDSFEVKMAQITGLTDGQESTVDLIKNKLVYDGRVEFENKVTIKDFFNLLEFAYKEEFNFIKTMYKLEVSQYEKGTDET